MQSQEIAPCPSEQGDYEDRGLATALTKAFFIDLGQVFPGVLPAESLSWQV